MTTNNSDEKHGLSVLLLRAVPLFSGIGEEALARLATNVSRHRVERGKSIIVFGDTNESLYIILTGSAKVTYCDKEGREVIISILGPRDFFGEMAVLDGEPSSASVITREPTEVLRLSKNDFLECLQNNFDVVQSLIGGLIKRLRDADRKIESLALLDVYGRVQKLLIEMAEQDSAGRMVLRERISKQNIAKMVGASREMVSRVMRELENCNFLWVEADQTYIQPKEAD